MPGPCETCVVPQLIRQLRDGTDEKFQEGLWASSDVREAVSALAEALIADGECKTGAPSTEDGLNYILTSCENTHVNDIDMITTAMSRLGSQIYVTIVETEK